MNLRLHKYFIISTMLTAFSFFISLAPRTAISQTEQSKDRKNIDQKSQGQKNQGESLLRLETELVQIDLVVTDKQGKLVRDLKREDFELFEDGKKQQITHFAAGTATQPAKWLTYEKKSSQKSPENRAITETLAGRFIVLAVDDYHLAPENLIITKRTLQKFIDNQMVAGDQIAVVTTSGVVGLFQQFTNDRTILERAINRLSVQNRSATSSFDVPRITDYQAELIDRGNPDALELAIEEILRNDPQPQPQAAGGARGAGRQSQNSQGGMSPRERATEQAKMKARMIVGENANYTRATLETLEGVIRSLRGLSGRKMLILLTDGFFLGGSSYLQTFDIHRITDAATRSGVVIYSIDARGLIATPPGGSASEQTTVETAMAGARYRVDAGEIEAKRDGINSLARDTGGFLVINNNDLNLGLKQVLDDNESYYVLAYEPPESRRDGKFHRIDVRIADRPNLKVRTRKGYLAQAREPEKAPEKAAEKQKEKSPEKIAQEEKAVRDSQIISGLASLFPLREIPVDFAAEYLEIDERASGVMLSAHIDAASIDFLRDNDLLTRAIDLTVAIFDENGKVANSYIERVTLNLKQENLETAIRNGLSYRRSISLNPGFYQARIAVREEGTARMGSASSWVEIPDLKKRQLTLSSIFLSVADDNPISQNAGEPPAGYKPKPSTPRHRFKSGSKFDFLVFAYNAKVEKATSDAVIQSQVYSGSKLVYASPLAKMNVQPGGDAQRMAYAARISLQGFDAGQYELRLVVIDRLNKGTAHRRVNFMVE